MRALIAGRMDGWMGIYWQQFARGFQQNEWDCATFDSRGADLRGVVRKLLPGDAEERLRRRRTDALCRNLVEFKPDLLLLHSLRFDFPQIRDCFTGRIVYWDIDGPAGPFGQDSLVMPAELDLFMTVSKPVLRRVQEMDSLKAFTGYLAHGVDPDYYCPGILNAIERKRFVAPMSFVGRPTERRIEHLSPLTNDGLIVWGRRWQKRPWNSEAFKPCIREKDNITGDEVIAVYRASGLFLNISREPFAAPPTTLNLQVFHVPAAGTCLLTERVEELEEAYDLEEEILSFQGVDEFVEKAQKFSHDRDAARRIGEAGRKRCQAHHTLRQRARQVYEAANQL